MKNLSCLILNFVRLLAVLCYNKTNNIGKMLHPAFVFIITDKFEKRLEMVYG